MSVQRAWCARWSTAVLLACASTCIGCAVNLPIPARNRSEPWPYHDVFRTRVHEELRTVWLDTPAGHSSGGEVLVQSRCEREALIVHMGPTSGGGIEVHLLFGMPMIGGTAAYLIVYDRRGGGPPVRVESYDCRMDVGQWDWTEGRRFAFRFSCDAALPEGNRLLSGSAWVIPMRSSPRTSGVTAPDPSPTASADPIAR
jgi:hypothetical protein